MLALAEPCGLPSPCLAVHAAQTLSPAARALSVCGWQTVSRCLIFSHSRALSQARAHRGTPTVAASGQFAQRQAAVSPWWAPAVSSGKPFQDMPFSTISVRSTRPTASDDNCWMRVGQGCTISVRAAPRPLVGSCNAWEWQDVSERTIPSHLASGGGAPGCDLPPGMARARALARLGRSCAWSYTLGPQPRQPQHGTGWKRRTHCSRQEVSSASGRVCSHGGVAAHAPIKQAPGRRFPKHQAPLRARGAQPGFTRSLHRHIPWRQRRSAGTPPSQVASLHYHVEPARRAPATETGTSALSSRPLCDA